MAFKKSTSRTNNAVELKESRYVQGGTTDRYTNRLDWWERKIIPQADSDMVITISPRQDRRPDLVAADIYGKPGLAWLVLQFNNIVDIETEFTTGKEIRLPTMRRVVLDILTQATGGNRIR